MSPSTKKLMPNMNNININMYCIFDKLTELNTKIINHIIDIKMFNIPILCIISKGFFEKDNIPDIAYLNKLFKLHEVLPDNLSSGIYGT